MGIITKRTRVVFISYNNGRVYRGGEIFVHELAKRLSRLGVNVWVIQGSKATRSQHYNVVHVKTNPNWKGRDFSGTWRRKLFIDKRSIAIAKFTAESLSQLKVINPDIIFSINGGWQSVILRLWCIIFGKKILFTSVSGKNWESKLDLFLFPSAYIALNNDIKSWARNVNPFIKNITVIPNGVDMTFFNLKGPRNELNLPKPIVLGVGAMSKQKRWPLLIKAVERCSTPCSLLLIGSGPEEAMIKGLGEKLLGPSRFHHISRVEPNEIPKYYRACDVVGFPSDSTEAQGIVCLEAMASGLPVVASKDIQRQQLLGPAGILEDPTKINNFSVALSIALNREWNGIPRSHAKKYSWDKVAKLYFQLISDIIGRYERKRD